MTTFGLLWYDASPKSLIDKLTPAIARHVARLGYAPTVCYVNPADDGVGQVGDIRIEARMNVLRGHYLLCDEAPELFKAYFRTYLNSTSDDEERCEFNAITGEYQWRRR